MLEGQSRDSPAGSTCGLSPGWAAFLGLGTAQTLLQGIRGPAADREEESRED